MRTVLLAWTLLLSGCGLLGGIEPQTSQELIEKVQAVIAEIDSDGDGSLTRTELYAWVEGGGITDLLAAIGLN